MPPSLSGSKLKSLGDRLRKSANPAPEDLKELHVFRDEFVPIVQKAQSMLLAAGFVATPRTKTSTSIIEKMRRDKTALSRMQDIGVLRVVLPMSLREQDKVAKEISGLFSEVELIDRRDKPNNGYRAIHLHVELDGFHLEIQVRTTLQDRWAQVNEKMGDLFGREAFRYGGTSEDAAVEQLRERLQEISRQIADHEVLVSKALGFSLSGSAGRAGSEGTERQEQLERIERLRSESAQALLEKLELTQKSGELTDGTATELARMRKELQTLRDELDALKRGNE